MSQLTKYVQAVNTQSYYFKIALDRIPDPDEKQDIKGSIRDAMESLGVPPEQVAVSVFKSDLPPEVNAEEEEGPEIVSDRRYLLFIIVRFNDELVFRQNHDEISQEITSEFTTYAEMDPANVTTVVLENAWLEIETKTHSSHPLLLW